jgi:rubrerythrin
MTYDSRMLAKYVEASRKLDTGDFPWHRVADHPLDAGARECLVYMADIEGYTIGYLRDLLNTSAIDDPEIARFMTLWAYEEMFHEEALQKFLGEYGVHFSSDRRAWLRKRTPWWDRATMMGASALSFLTRDFVAVYMTWGALNELTTLTAYERLAERAGHPLLAELLARIVKDERRHFSFYYQQAKQRLEASAWARRMTREILRRFWRPVGNGVKTPAEMAETVGYCFAGELGRAAAHEADQRVGALPGLAGFSMIVDFLDEIGA